MVRVLWCHLNWKCPQSLPLISSNGLDGQSRLKWDILDIPWMQNFSSSSFLLGFSCLSFMHNTQCLNYGRNFTREHQPNFSSSCLLNKDEGHNSRKSIDPRIQHFNPFEVAWRLKRSSNGFWFFFLVCPKANQMQSLLQITLTTQVVKQQQIENARNHGSSRGKNEGIIRCVSTSHLELFISDVPWSNKRKSWVIKVAHVQYINSRYSIQRMMMVKKKRPKEWVGRGGRIQQSDEEERCYSCVSNPMWTFELDIWPR